MRWFKKRLCIIQPARIGDLIIVAPIAHYYHEMGYEVYMPIISNQFEAFSYAFPYINWISIDVPNIEEAALKAKEVAAKLNVSILNLSFGFVGEEKLHKKWKKSGLSFDAYKYKLAKVPFEEKYKLRIRRNSEREEALFKRVIQQKKPYTLLQLQGSNYRREVNLSLLANPIEIQPLTSNIFDWLKILEKADQRILVDSCFANLVEQLGLQGCNTLLTPDDRRLCPYYDPRRWTFH